MERSRVGLAKDHRDATTVPPSRAAALQALRAAVEAQSGPVLVTGDVGVGKTWLWRRLQDELPGPWRWVGVDLTPAIEPAAFYRLVGHGLGLAAAETVADGRIVLADFLKDRHADGDRWVLTIDEVHNASTAVWEEARVLTNRLGRPDGFAGLLLIGQTPVARRLTTRALAAVEARVSARIHLRPLDSDEARDLLRAGAGASGPGLSAEALERLHRDAAGNTRRLFPRVEPDRRRPHDPVDLAPAPESSFERETAWESPLLGPSRPALQEEDGVIEVGWSPADEPETETTALTPDLANVPVVTTGATEGEETIDDRYAALQAWTEWARNQGRSPARGSAAPVEGGGGDDEARDDVPLGSGAVGAAVHGVWAEGQQGFAPYGQLFSKLRQPRDPG